MRTKRKNMKSASDRINEDIKVPKTRKAAVNEDKEKHKNTRLSDVEAADSNVGQVVFDMILESSAAIMIERRTEMEENSENIDSPNNFTDTLNETSAIKSDGTENEQIQETIYVNEALCNNVETINEDGPVYDKKPANCKIDKAEYSGADNGTTPTGDAEETDDGVTDSQLCAADWSSQAFNETQSNNAGISTGGSAMGKYQSLSNPEEVFDDGTAVVVTLVKELQQLNKSILKTTRELEAASRQRPH